MNHQSDVDYDTPLRGNREAASYYVAQAHELGVPVRLHLGSGTQNLDGWIGVDLEPHDGWEGAISPEVTGDVRALPFEDECADDVMMKHVLEHIELDEQYRAIHEAWRVLKPGGRLMVIGPDVEKAKVNWPQGVYTIYPGLRVDLGDDPGHWDDGAVNTGEPRPGHQWVQKYPRHSPGKPSGHVWSCNSRDQLFYVSHVFPDAVEIPMDSLGPDENSYQEWPCSWGMNWMFAICATK